ncbi:MAG: hypothetical protein P1Q69_07840 [Candidatus Thorarchaeota archaeon]|nr:hypothetical protein [Candidatus Thorarchaeota archaeon]
MHLVPSNPVSFGGIGNFSFTILDYQITEIEMDNITISDATGYSTIQTNPSSNSDSSLFSDATLRFSIGMSSVVVVVLLGVFIIKKKSN